MGNVGKNYIFSEKGSTQQTEAELVFMPTTRPNQRLKSERELRGWSQAYLAEQIGAYNYYISRWERGEMMPSPYYQQKLCELFGKTAEELGFRIPEEIEATQPASTAGLTANVSSEPPSPEAPPLTASIPEPSSSTPIQPFWQRHVRLLLAAVFVLLPVLGGAGSLISIRILQAFANPPPVGTFSFTSSDVDNTTSSQGVADGIQIQITLNRQPASGMAYYAWLMPDQNQPEDNTVRLGPLTLHGTTGTLSFNDPFHTNLLLAHGGLLVTEQPMSPFPQSPSLSANDARYQATIPQTPGTNTPTYSLLKHLRHLFASDPELDNYQLDGGLIVWMMNNTKLLATWAQDAQVAWEQKQTDAFHQDLLDMIDYLDGLKMVQQDPNLSGQESVATNLSPDQHQWGQLGLLDVQSSQSTDTEGYLPHIQYHLKGIYDSPGVTNQQQDLAKQLTIATSALMDWLYQARKDLYMLLSNSPQTQQLLADLKAQAVNAANGYLNPSTKQEEPGALQIERQMMQFLNFPITSA